MTDYSAIFATRPEEYGYGVGYNYAYGAVSAPYTAHATFPPTPEFYINFQHYPPEFIVAPADKAGISVGLDSGRTSAGDEEGTYAFAELASFFAVVDEDTNLALSATPPASSVLRYFFYDKIHLMPNAFQLGIVASDRTFTVVVWNGFLVNVVAGSITKTGASGITESLTPLVPDTITALDVINWDFTVSGTEGDNQINARFILNSGGVGYAVTITGVRAAELPITHNWISPLIETLSWKTSLVVTYNGTESRAALRDVARRAIDTTLYLNKSDIKRIENVMFKWQARNVLIPIPQYKSKLTAPALIGDLTLYLDTTDLGFSADQAVMLINENSKVAESFTVGEVFSNRLTLQSPTSKAWSTGASVYPAGGAKLRGNLPIVWQTQDFATGKAVFDFEPTRVNPLTPTAAASTLYRGEEVLLTEPDWEGGLSKDSSFEGIVIDNETGVVAVAATHYRPSRSLTFRWLLNGVTKITNFRKFLNRRKGMAVSFWMPSWVNDFSSIVKTYESGDTTLRFADNGFFINSAMRVERSHVMIDLTSGVRLFREIVSAEEITANLISEISFDTSYGVRFLSSEIVRVSFLSRYRLNADEVSLEWLNEKLVAVSLPLVTVPDYPAQDHP